jgi:hypothetical protein
MLVVQCILWVANMTMACSKGNTIWPLNALAALYITIEVAGNMS